MNDATAISKRRDNALEHSLTSKFEGNEKNHDDRDT